MPPRPQGPPRPERRLPPKRRDPRKVRALQVCGFSGFRGFLRGVYGLVLTEAKLVEHSVQASMLAAVGRTGRVKLANTWRN